MPGRTGRYTADRPENTADCARGAHTAQVSMVTVAAESPWKVSLGPQGRLVARVLGVAVEAGFSVGNPRDPAGNGNLSSDRAGRLKGDNSVRGDFRRLFQIEVWGLKYFSLIG